MRQPSAVGTSPSLPTSILDVVLALDLALERRALYPAAHPLVAASRDGFVRAWQSALAELGSIRLWIAAGRLGWGVEEMQTVPGPRAEPLSRLLHSMNLTGIEADREATPADLLALLDLIHSLRFDPRPLETIQNWLRQSEGRLVRVTSLDVDSFQYGDRRLDAPPAEIWAGLHQYLGGGASSPSGIARTLAAMLHDQGPGGVGTLRAEILDSLDRAGADEEQDLADRIRRLLVVLPEGMRADLLRIDTPTGSSLLARLLRPLPARDALTSLLQIGHVDGKMPKGTTTILTQILHCLPDGEAVSQAVLGTPPSDAPDVSEVARALESIFSRRTDDEFNPEDYQHRLDELARQENLSPSTSRRRAEGLSDAAGLSAQVGGIAAMSLADARPDEVRPILEAVERSLPGLLERERLDLLAVVARGIRERPDEESGPSGRITTRLVDQLETLFRLGGLTDESRDDLRDVLSLLPSGPVGREALRRLLTGRPGSEPKLLQVILLDRDGGLLAELLDDAVAQSPERVHRLRPVFRAARSAEVRALLDRLVTHEDVRVRRMALSIAVEQEDGPRRLEMLERAILDPDGEISRWALQSLASSPEGVTDVTELLGRILETRGTSLPGVVSSRMALLLVQRGEDGVHRAAALVDRFLRTPRVRTARLARYVVTRLAPFRKDPVVRSVLRHWTWSLARLLGSLPVRGG